MSLTISPEGSIVNTTSTSSRRDGMQDIIVISLKFMELSSSNPKTSFPPFARFIAMGAPMLPRPMKPIFKFISIYLNRI